MAVSLLSIAALALPAPRIRIGELKSRATRFGVDTSSLFEKSDLVAALEARAPGASRITSGHAVPLVAVGAAGGAMGAGVTVDSGKTFWGIKLELPDIASPARASEVLFVLDSAATHSLLSPEASTLLAAKPTGASASASTASAAAVQSGYAQVNLGLPSLSGGYSVGAVPLQPVVMSLPVAPGPYARACGLLGLDFLSRCDVELRLRPMGPLAVFYPPRAADAAEAQATAGAGATQAGGIAAQAGGGDAAAAQVRVGASATQAGGIAAQAGGGDAAAAHARAGASDADTGASSSLAGDGSARAGDGAVKAGGSADQAGDVKARGEAAADGVDLKGLVRLQGKRIPPVGLLAVTVDLSSSSADGGRADGKIGSVDAVVDLGSCVTVCNWAAAARVGLMPGDSRLNMGDQVIAGASGEAVRVSEARIAISCGGMKARQVAVCIADLPIFSAIGLNGPAMVLGLDALAPNSAKQKGSRVVLSAAANAVWVEQ